MVTLFRDVQRREKKHSDVMLFVEHEVTQETMERLNFCFLPFCIRRKALAVCVSRPFNIVVPVVIMANALYVCASAHDSMRTALTCWNEHPGQPCDPGTPLWATILDITFAVLFTVEMAFKFL